MKETWVPMVDNQDLLFLTKCRDFTKISAQPLTPKIVGPPEIALHVGVFEELRELREVGGARNVTEKQEGHEPYLNTVGLLAEILGRSSGNLKSIQVDLLGFNINIPKPKHSISMIYLYLLISPHKQKINHSCR